MPATVEKTRYSIHENISMYLLIRIAPGIAYKRSIEIKHGSIEQGNPVETPEHNKEKAYTNKGCQGGQVLFFTRVHGEILYIGRPVIDRNMVNFWVTELLWPIFHPGIFL